MNVEFLKNEKKFAGSAFLGLLMFHVKLTWSTFDPSGFGALAWADLTLFQVQLDGDGSFWTGGNSPTAYWVILAYCFFAAFERFFWHMFCCHTVLYSSLETLNWVQFWAWGDAHCFLDSSLGSRQVRNFPRIQNWHLPMLDSEHLEEIWKHFEGLRPSSTHGLPETTPDLLLQHARCLLFSVQAGCEPQAPENFEIGSGDAWVRISGKPPHKKKVESDYCSQITPKWLPTIFEKPTAWTFCPSGTLWVLYPHQCGVKSLRPAA